MYSPAATFPNANPPEASAIVLRNPSADFVAAGSTVPRAVPGARNEARWGSARAGPADGALFSHNTAPDAAEPCSLVATPVTATARGGGGGATVESFPQPGIATAKVASNARNTLREIRCDLIVSRPS